MNEAAGGGVIRINLNSTPLFQLTQGHLLTSLRVSLHRWVLTDCWCRTSSIGPGSTSDF